MGEANGRMNGKPIEGAVTAKMRQKAAEEAKKQVDAIRAQVAERMKLTEAVIGRFLASHPNIAHEPQLNAHDAVALLCEYSVAFRAGLEDLHERLTALEAKLCKDERRVLLPEELAAAGASPLVRP